MSISKANGDNTDFTRWIVEEFAHTGAFTALVVLVRIGEQSVSPLCSTYMNVIGDEFDWADLTVLFAGSGMDWDGAAFFSATDKNGGPLDNPTARLKLREIEDRFNKDRLTLNQGHFFDKWGRRMKIEEVGPK
ncbi:MAG: hypothetical protein AB7P50_20815 [Alphaproteobacteria bacterium]